MKTIREWLKKELTTDHYLLAKKYEDYTGYRSWEGRVCSAHEALDMAIAWYRTQEGSCFWSEIYKQLKEGRYEKYSNNIFLKL